MLSSELGSRVPNCVFSNRVIEEELKDVPSQDVPPLTPLAVEGKTEQEEKLVKQLSKMIRIVGDRVQHDQEFQE